MRGMERDCCWQSLFLLREVGTLEKLDSVVAVFQKCLLAENMTEGEVREFLASSRVQLRRCHKGEVVFNDGDMPHSLYVLLSGRVHIQKESFTGRHIFLSEIDEPGDVFGEVYLLMGRPYDMYVEAARDTELLVMESEAFSLTGKEVSEAARLVQRNLMRILARKAYFMHTKLKVLSSGSLREKIVRYLFWGMDGEGKIHLDVNRENWAQYLAVARPSLSRELGTMQQEGLLEVRGREIRVLDKAAFESYL